MTMPLTVRNRATGADEIERVPLEGTMRFLYGNPLGRLSLWAIVRRKWLSNWMARGRRSKKSQKDIATFVTDYGVDMSESVTTLADFESFEEFFVRRLKPGARPIAPGEDVAVMPADGRALVYPDIDIEALVQIKGSTFTLAELLGDGALAQRYRGGAFVVVRLAPVDYHRFHFPIDCTPGECRLIPGAYYSVSPVALSRMARIYCRNKRTVTELESERFGKVIFLDVGATFVGGTHQTYTPGVPVEKGAEKGYFSFGGSTVALLFEKGRIRLDDDLVKSSAEGVETKVRMGESLGRV